MSSAKPAQVKGKCGHLMPSFDKHINCVKCRHSGKGRDTCVLGDLCYICEGFSPEESSQLAKITYKDKKLKKDKESSIPVSTSTTTTPVVSVSPKCSATTTSNVPGTPSRAPISTNAVSKEELDSKFVAFSEEIGHKLETFMQNFTAKFKMPVAVQAPAPVSATPFFPPMARVDRVARDDPAISSITPLLSSSAGSTGIKSTEAALFSNPPTSNQVSPPSILPVTASGSSAAPVVVAAQPVPVISTSADILPDTRSVTNTVPAVTVTSGSLFDNAAPLQSQVMSDGECSDQSPDSDQELSLSDSPDKESLSEDQNYRETMRGLRTIMMWKHIPDFETSAASEDNPFKSRREKPDFC